MLRVLALFVCAAALAACGDPPPPPAPEARIYAAASLADVVGELSREFERTHGVRVVAAYGPSNTLAQQIRDGAAPGVFVSASVEWADRVEAWGLAEPGTRADLASNALVVVVPKGAAARPASLADLADPRFARVALADPVAVPAGRYAQAALETAGAFASVRTKVVAAQDVRTALSYVARGEADAGIVYATDAAASAEVDVAFRVPPELHPRVVYPALLVRGAPAPARDLHAFLRTEAAWRAFERAGFVRP